MANAVPDSRMPRRFSSVMTSTTSTASSTRCEFSDGTADRKLATPEETDTATVSM